MSVRMDSDWEILRPAPGEAGELRYTWAGGGSVGSRHVTDV